MAFSMIEVILYCVQFSRQLSDEEVERISRIILEQPPYDRTVQEQYEAIEADLEAEAWERVVWDQPHDGPAIQDFLRRLLEHLDTLRPWQEPPFRDLGTDRWEEFKRGTLLARVRLRLHYPVIGYLRTVPEEENGLRGLVLRLRSGDEVALIAPPLPDRSDAVLMAAPPHRSAREVTEAFLTHTGLPREQVSPAVRRWWGRQDGGTRPPWLESPRG
ncbi:hypothetical protein ACWCPM_07470 [Streptomyces sp. NPDC002309]